LSAAILDALAHPVHALAPPPVPADAGEDLQLALYLCYELRYRGAPGVDPEWEWEPSLLALRRELEHRFLAARPPSTGEAPDAPEMDLALRALADADDGPSLSRHL